MNANTLLFALRTLARQLRQLLMKPVTTISSNADIPEAVRAVDARLEYTRELRETLRS